VDEMTARVLWPMAAINPISYEEYKALAPKKPEDPQSFSDSIAHAYHRYGLASLLVKQGGFTTQEAWILLYDHPGDRAPIERRAAVWLLSEFNKIPKGKEASGKSPKRILGLLSPLEIADVAIAMLDYDCRADEKPPPSSELVALLAQLLDVRRHRDTFANSGERSRKFALAAQIDGQAALHNRPVRVRVLAGLVSVSAGTIVTWRQSARYKELVDFEKQRPFIVEPPPPTA
jgi:hypothetical protein